MEIFTADFSLFSSTYVKKFGFKVADWVFAMKSNGFSDCIEIY